MNTINPTTNAHIEQLERELLDAIYEQALTRTPETDRISKEIQRLPQGDERAKELFRELEAVTGGSTKSMAEWLIKGITADSRVQKAREQYVLARNLLAGAGAL